MRRTNLTLGAAMSATLVLSGGAAATAATTSTSAPRTCAQPNGRVATIAIDHGTAFLGGSFTGVKDRAGVLRDRAGAAAIDTTTCDLLSWSPTADGAVAALVVAGDTVYLGGQFTKVNGQSRLGIAAVTRGGGSLTSFRHDMNRPVRTLAASSTTLYAGGDFSSVDGYRRQHLAAFMLADGRLDGGWKPVANGAVTTLALSPDAGRVYVGGSFGSLNADTGLPYLGAVDSTTGSTTGAFRPHASFPMLAVTSDSRGVYAGGGGSGGHLGIWDASGRLVQPIYQTDGGVQAVAVDGDNLYAGGHFTNYCQGNTGHSSPYQCDQPLSRRKLFKVSLNTGAVTEWAPALNSARGVFTAGIEPGTHDLWTGGDFTKVDGKNVAHLAVFP